jgi:hypothetical protein
MRTMFCAVLFVFVAASLGMLHAQKVAGPNRPAGVPDGYVITPFGYFHPSCVRHIAAGATVLADGRVQHADGAVDEKAPVCNYPRYSPTGKLVTADTAKEEPPSIRHSWIEDGNTATNTAYGEISATWTVPPSPTADDGQTIYFFTGFDNYSSDISILQPVLEWNSNYTNAWGIASWNCCPSGTADHSSAVSVSPGDTILGTVTSTCSAGTESCSTWNITTDDQSSGLSTTLSNTPSEGQTLNWAFAGALEVYNVAQCSDYPPNGPIIFNASLYDDNFNLISNPGWSITNYSSGLTPQCNYGGQVSGTQVTLEYSAGSCTTVPSAPTGLAASSTTSSGTSLSWTGDTAPANCSITSYTVLEDGNPIGTATSTSYTVSSLSPSTTYSFTVEATDTDGTSAASSAVSVTTTPQPGYSLSTSPTQGTVSPGGSSTATVTVGSANGYTGSVTLLCAISPVGHGSHSSHLRLRQYESGECHQQWGNRNDDVRGRGFVGHDVAQIERVLRTAAAHPGTGTDRLRTGTARPTAEQAAGLVVSGDDVGRAAHSSGMWRRRRDACRDACRDLHDHDHWHGCEPRDPERSRRHRDCYRYLGPVMN